MQSKKLLIASAIRSAVIIASLSVCLLVVSRLPLFVDVEVAPGLASAVPLELAGVLAIFVTLAIFASALIAYLQSTHPQAPFLASMARSLSFLLLSLGGYLACRPLAWRLFGSAGWVFELISWLLVFAALATVVYSAVNDAGKLSAWLLRSRTRAEAYCPWCGTPGTLHDRFCRSCGRPPIQAQEPSRCPNCGEENNLGSHFCSHCGVLLDSPTQPEEPGEILHS